MAKVKLSGVISQVTGKLNGSVFQGSPNGLILRGNSAKCIIQDNTSTLKKNRFLMIARLWSSMPQSNRDAWNRLATGKASGYALFQRKNVITRTIATAPVLLPAPGIVDYEISVPVVTTNVSGSVFSAAWLYTGPANAAYVYFYASQPLGLSLANLKTKVKRLTATGAQNSPFSLTTNYINRYGVINRLANYLFVIRVYCPTQNDFTQEFRMIVTTP